MENPTQEKLILEEYTTTWDDGAKKCVYTRDQYGRLQGEKLHWTSCGALISRCNYLNGHRHGLREEWFKNGEPKIHINYKYGDLFGIYKVWYNNGHLGTELGDYKIVLEDKTEIDFLEDPELKMPTTQEEKMLFNLKYGKVF